MTWSFYLTVLGVFFLGSCTTLHSKTPLLLEKGLASWYGKEFQGRPTASGELYDMGAFTAAHRTLPFGTLVTVTSLSTGRSVIVRISDRGPFHSERIIDVSYAAALKLDLVHRGEDQVTLRVD